MGNDPFGAGVEAGRDRLVERCDLGNPHQAPSMAWTSVGPACRCTDRPSDHCRISRRITQQRLFQLLRIDQQVLAGAATAGHGNPDEGGQPPIGGEREAVDLLRLDVDATGARRDSTSQILEGEWVAERDVIVVALIMRAAPGRLGTSSAKRLPASSQRQMDIVGRRSA